MTDLNKVHFDQFRLRHYMIKIGQDGQKFKVWID